MSTLAERMSVAKSYVVERDRSGAARREGVQRSGEFSRISNLPRRQLKLDAIEDLTPLFKLGKVTCQDQHCHICAKGSALLPLQSAMLWEAEHANGLFAAVGVGHGKTLASFLLPEVMESKVSVLLIPPNLRDKTHTDLRVLGRHFRLPGRKQEIVAYSELSSAGSADVLDRIKPDLIIADEAHALRHKDAARTKRFLRYMKENPSTRFCALSGTMTDKSIRDYAHLIEIALRKNSPLPFGWRELCEWSDALDVSEDPLPPGVLIEFCTPEEAVNAAMNVRDVVGVQKAARSGFRRRLVETPGVVATEEGAIGTSLYIWPLVPAPVQTIRDCADALEKQHGFRPLPGKNVQTRPGAWLLPYSELPQVIDDALARIRETWEIADEELVDAMSVARIARQLALGFYYRWLWPNGKDQEWLRARSAWHKAVRHVLRYKARAGLDSPLLVARAAVNGDLSPEELAAWGAWCEVKDRPEPPIEAVWLSDFAVKDAARLALAAPRIVWCSQRAVGEKIAELTGLPWLGGGTDAELEREDGTRSIICSVKAHGTGKNLQAWSMNLVTCPPVNAVEWEQMLGRTHRPGQQADEVIVDYYNHTPELQAAYDAAIVGAEYIEQTQGQRQKLLYARVT